MAVQAFIFYLFATIVTVSATATILSRNPVHSVLWLVLAFLNAAGLFVLLGAEFLAMLLIIVYVGAVAVLFLFVVMMLDIDFAELRAGFARYMPFGLLLALVLAAELVMIAGAWQSGAFANQTRAVPITGSDLLSNTQALGNVLYTRYVFVFQTAGLILLTALVGAVVLTHRQRSDVPKRQSIAQQVARQPEEVVYMAKVRPGEGVDVG